VVAVLVEEVVGCALEVFCGILDDSIDLRL